MKTLTIIGSGQVAKTLGHLFHRHQCFDIVQIVSRSFENAINAQRFIGAGEALHSLLELNPSDVYLIAVRDEQIDSVCTELSKLKIIQPGNTVFHCSGALTSRELSVLLPQGASIASAHPIKNFSHPEIDVAKFPGSFCSVEGNKEACSLLEKKLQMIGANVIKIKAEQKLLYHAGIVMSTNYLVALVESSLRVFDSIGIDKDIGLQLLQPIMLNIYERIFDLGPRDALTGPIVRGDVQIVEQQLLRLKSLPDVINIYRSLGKIAVDLVDQRSILSEDVLEKLRDIFVCHSREGGNPSMSCHPTDGAPPSQG